MPGEYISGIANNAKWMSVFIIVFLVLMIFNPWVANTLSTLIGDNPNNSLMVFGIQIILLIILLRMLIM
jgi:hypothetical protein